MISVSRSDIRGNVQCPICLGIIKRTRVVMGCQHRFCRECIDKSMRLGNNECPACRIHCASRRSLRDDPIFDAIIKAIYPDVEKYEEEELVFHEEERALNQQPEAFTWGRGGVRSHVRHGNPGSSRNGHANRLSKLTNYLKSGQRNECQQDAHLQLVSLNVEETPSLDKPYLCCDSNLSINDIREHIAHEVKSQTKDIEIVSMEEKDNENSPNQNSSNSSSELQILPGQETLAGIQSNYHSSKDLTLGYMQKKPNICILD
nr:putative E3 ubiquitin-protein ligase RING1a isoform X2 [Ipomoea batatas]